MKRQARNRLSVWGVSWDLPLPASQGSSILFTKYSAHIETRTVWLHVKGDGEGLSRVDFEVLEASLPGDSPRPRAWETHSSGLLPGALLYLPS